GGGTAAAAGMGRGLSGPRVPRHLPCAAAAAIEGQTPEAQSGKGPSTLRCHLVQPCGHVARAHRCRLPAGPEYLERHGVGPVDHRIRLRAGTVASSSPASAMAKAITCSPLKLSPRNSTPTRAALMGSMTVNTPAREAGTDLSPVIHNHTVHTLAASA